MRELNKFRGGPKNTRIHTMLTGTEWRSQRGDTERVDGSSPHQIGVRNVGQVRSSCELNGEEHRIRPYGLATSKHDHWQDINVRQTANQE